VSSIRSRSLSIVGGGRTRQTASPLPSSTFDQRRLAPLPSLSLCIFVSSTPLHALLFNPRKNVTSLSPCSPSRVDILAEQATNRRAHLLSLLVCPFPFATGSRTCPTSPPPQKKKIPIMSTYAADASSSTNGADSKPVVTPQDIGWQFVPQY
jgi:hypothetical protein